MPLNDLRISRRTVLASVPAFALASRIAATPAQTGLPFVAIGDWGRDGASHQRDVAVQMGRSAHASGSRFVISTGDNFYNSGVHSVSDRQWQTSFEQIYSHPALYTPWYPVLGNHDYRGNPQAEVDYSVTSNRWRMPARYHSVSGATAGAPEVEMFFIDTSPLVHKYRDKVESVIAHNVASQDAAAQLAWLDGALARSGAAWKLVFGHHTIFSGGSSHGNTAELVAQLKPILERRGVQAYVNGHEHDLQHIRVGTVDYICTGAGSEVRPTGTINGTLFALARSGFATFNVERDRLALTFVDYTGKTVYRTLLGRERALA